MDYGEIYSHNLIMNHLSYILGLGLGLGLGLRLGLGLGWLQ